MVQTYEYKTKSTIMMREMGTQMDVGLGSKCDVTGLFMDTRNDKIIRPNKHYFSSRMWAKEREETTLGLLRRKGHADRIGAEFWLDATEWRDPLRTPA